MENKWKVEHKFLMMDNKAIDFSYPIEKVNQYGNTVIVLLEYKSEYDPSLFLNSLFGLSLNGDIIWKMEHPKEKGIKTDPLVDFQLINNELVVFDYSAHKLIIDLTDGKIIRHQTGRW